MNFFSHLIRSLFHQDHRNPYTQLTRDRYNGDSRSDLARVLAANRAEKLLSSPSCRIADQDAWMSLLLSRSSPVRVIDPRSTSPRWSARWAPIPKPSQLMDVIALANRRCGPRAGWR